MATEPSLFNPDGVLTVMATEPSLFNPDGVLTVYSSVSQTFIFSRGLLSSKNNHGPSQPCLRRYRVTMIGI
jgi:hypothetical protein